MKLHLVVGCPTRASTSSCFLEYSTRQLREVSHSWIVSKVQGLLQGDRGGLTILLTSMWKFRQYQDHYQ